MHEGGVYSPKSTFGPLSVVAWEGRGYEFRGGGGKGGVETPSLCTGKGKHSTGGECESRMGANKGEKEDLSPRPFLRHIQ